MSTAITLENVTKVFGPKPHSVVPRLEAGEDKATILAETGHTVGLYRIALEIPAGSLSVIMGLSGSGKSTLIRHLNRLIDPTAGRILVDGEDILRFSGRKLRRFRRTRMAMVFQSFALLPHLCVRDNVAFGLRIRGMSKAKRHTIAEDWITRVGLEGFGDQLPGQLSGGMRQRVGLARALANDPDVILMDEAFSALDPLIRLEMQDLLRALQTTLQKTVVFITHDLDEALAIGDHIAILRDGKLVQAGTPRAIVQAPADDFVQRFTAHVNRGRFLTAADAMSPMERSGRPDGPSVLADTVLDRVLPALTEPGRSLLVVRDGKTVGTLDQTGVIKALAGKV